MFAGIELERGSTAARPLRPAEYADRNETDRSWLRWRRAMPRWPSKRNNWTLDLHNIIRHDNFGRVTWRLDRLHRVDESDRYRLLQRRGGRRWPGRMHHPQKSSAPRCLASLNCCSIARLPDRWYHLADHGFPLRAVSCSSAKTRFIAIDFSDGERISTSDGVFCTACAAIFTMFVILWYVSMLLTLYIAIYKECALGITFTI